MRAIEIAAPRPPRPAPIIMTCKHYSEVQEMVERPYIELVRGIAALLLNYLRLRPTHYVTADMPPTNGEQVVTISVAKQV